MTIVKLHVRFPIAQAMFCLDADIGGEEARDIAYNVGWLVSRGTC